MISRTELNERIREWGIREDVIEKDYVIGWTLWSIGSNALLSDGWAFKGGTCLKKCYVETFRFSEDLDFTVLPGGPSEARNVVSILKGALERAHEESGIDFQAREPVMRTRPDGQSAEGRIYYRGPRNAPGVASLRLDLTTAEHVARPTVLRPITHPYPDSPPSPAQIRCYSFEEAFAEKLRAMGERTRPRDLYDIITVFRGRGALLDVDSVLPVYEEKCASKGVKAFDFEAIQASPFRRELESEWDNMLSHQLPALPPFSVLWEELPHLYGWLERRASIAETPLIPVSDETDGTWRPPSAVSVWHQIVPLELVRFAAANRLCVELGYRDDNRLVEPYSLRRNRSGQLTLHVVESDSEQVRTYDVEDIRSVRMSAIPFHPRFAVEITGMGAFS